MVRFFYTFHRCASKFIGKFCDLDYAWMIYNKSIRAKKSYDFKDGKMYGPIRISEDKISPIYLLNQSSYDYTPKIGVFMTRNKEDIMRSEYKTFGGSHGMSPLKSISEIQFLKQKKIQGMTEDEYLEYRKPYLDDEFDSISQIADSCEESVFVTYEEMVNDFDSFKKKTQPYFNKEIVNGSKTW